MENNAVTKWLKEKFIEISPYDFYRGIFPCGELDSKDQFTKGKYTGIIVAIEKGKKSNGKPKVKRYTLTDELEAVQTVIQSNDFCICSPLSYAGKERSAKNARMLYAIAVDLDKIRLEINLKTGQPTGLGDLWHQIMVAKYIPRPTYMVSSGSGLHLYYVLDNPMPMYEDIAFELQEFKRELTGRIWNDFIVDIKDQKEVQQEGIYQGFRMPGTITKRGDRARAFITGEKVTIEYLNNFVDDISKAKKAEEYKRGKTRLSEAKEKWGSWYERRIIKGEKRGHYALSRSVYDWWKKEILSGAKVGHRYYCMMILAIFAQKCSYYGKRNLNPVTREELENDCFELLDHMESLTENEDNHFTEADILDALEAFDEKWITYPRASIEYRSGITIPKQKRNYQKQAEHLEEARAIRDIRAQRRGERWDMNRGRKSKSDVVNKWRTDNPNGTIKECILETGLGKSTVYRHWNGELTPAENKAKINMIKSLEESAIEWERIIAKIEAEINENQEVSEAQKTLLEMSREQLKNVQAMKERAYRELKIEDPSRP